MNTSAQPGKATIRQAHKACATVADILGRNPKAKPPTEIVRAKLKARTEALACSGKAAND